MIKVKNIQNKQTTTKLTNYYKISQTTTKMTTYVCLGKNTTLHVKSDEFDAYVREKYGDDKDWSYADENDYRMGINGIHKITTIDNTGAIVPFYMKIYDRDEKFHDMFDSSDEDEDEDGGLIITHNYATSITDGEDDGEDGEDDGEDGGGEKNTFDLSTMSDKEKLMLLFKIVSRTECEDAISEENSISAMIEIIVMKTDLMKRTLIKKLTELATRQVVTENYCGIKKHMNLIVKLIKTCDSDEKLAELKKLPYLN